MIKKLILLFAVTFYSFIGYGQLMNNNALLGSEEIYDPDIEDGIVFAYSETAMLSRLVDRLYSPMILQNGDKTIIAAIKEPANDWNQALLSFEYERGYGFQEPVSVSLPQEDDNNHAQVAINYNGGKYFMFQTNWQSTPYYIYESNGDDVTSWINPYPISKVVGSGQALEYCKIFTHGSANKIVARWITSQLDYTESNHKVFTATSGNTGWDSGIDLHEKLTEAGGIRLYSTVPSNGHNRDGWYYIDLSSRSIEGTNSLAWYQKYVIKTQDFETWYNIDESWSQDITSAAITKAQLDANCLYWTSGSNVKTGRTSVSSVDPDGNYFAITDDGELSSDYEFVYYDGAAWQTLPITLTGETIVESESFTIDNQMPAFQYLWSFNEFVHYTAVRVLVDVGGTDYSHFKIYKTVDGGSNWTFVLDCNQGQTEDFAFMLVPEGAVRIPPNQNFGVAFTTHEPNADIWLGKMAWGSVQPDVLTKSITPVTELDDISGLVRHYKVSAATITNTGTTLNSLVDQSSAGQNATSSGSPVLDDATTPTLVNFDGVNDYCDIPVTGLTALDDATIMFVARIVDAGTIFAPITFSVSTAAQPNMYFTLVDDGTQNNSFSWQGRFGAAAVTSNQLVRLFGQDEVDTNFVLVTFIQDGSCPKIYINGKRQHYEDEIVVYDVLLHGRRQLYKFTQHFGTTLNRVTIGAQRRNTNTFYKGQFKELAVWNRALTEEERREAEKRLATDHSITLQDEYTQ